MARRNGPIKMTVTLAAGQTVSALLLIPKNPAACYVFAHGAGAGMDHHFMADVADGLAARNIATLRYQFPFMEAGSRRTDRPEVANDAVRAAVATAALKLPGIRLIAGGKSFGGRMTSQTQAASPMRGVKGLAFFGFPLHPAGKPSITRADHLSALSLPTLFLQGTNDKLAEVALIKPVIESMGPAATLHLVKDADHSFHVPQRSGRTDEAVMTEMLDVFVQWAGALPSGKEAQATTARNI